MKILRENLLAIAFALASFVVVFALYGQMPETVPIHWDAHGVANGWMAKPWGPLLLPLSSLGLVLLLTLLRVISPKEASLARFARVFAIVNASLAGFFFVLTLLASLVAIGIHVDMRCGVLVPVGVLFVILGNYMGKFTRNYFVGIRTPWTLSNDEVWFRTHRLGGKVFVLAGIGIVLSAFAGAPFSVFLVLTFAAALIPVVYSYVVYQKLNGANR